MDLIKSAALALIELTVFFAAYMAGGSVKHCQTVIVQDIAEHQKFEAELSKQVNPDFLTTLTKGRP